MKSPRVGVLTHGHQERLEIRVVFLPASRLASMQLSGLENKVHPQEAFRATVEAMPCSRLLDLIREGY